MEEQDAAPSAWIEDQRPLWELMEGDTPLSH